MKPLVFLFALIFCTLTASFAQVKIGYTNADAILAALPEAKQIESDLKAYQGQIEKEMQSKYAEFQQKLKVYQETANDMPKVVRDEREKELQELQKRVQDFEKQAQLDLQKKNSSLLAPVYQKIQTGIDEVAKAEGFTFVFSSDASGFPILLYADEQHDITNKVIVKLGGKPLEKKPEEKEKKN